MTETFDRLGYGTYKLDSREKCVESIIHAIETGYRHLDTAQMYENESFVGEAIAQSSVDREDLFVATKLNRGNTAYDDAIATARASRDRLGIDTIDLLYVHWPTDTYDPDETLPALDDLVEEGVAANIGLSNFRPDQLEVALDTLNTDVFAHQVECHPLCQQDELRRYAIEAGHWLVAYSPLARNRVADSELLQEIAAAHDVSPAAVSLAWLLSKDRVAAIPKASTPTHIEANWAARELELTDDELARIDAIDREERAVDFEGAPWNQV